MVMRVGCVLLMCVSLVGCQTMGAIKESGGNHPVAYLGVQAATQVAAYQYAKKMDEKDYKNVEAVIEALSAVSSDPTVYDWEAGRMLITVKVPQPYVMGALLIYGIVESELSPRIEQGNVTVEVAHKYIQMAIIGIKSGLAQARAERG